VVIITKRAVLSVNILNLMSLYDLGCVPAPSILYITCLDLFHRGIDRDLCWNYLRYGAVGGIGYPPYGSGIHRSMGLDDSAGLHSDVRVVSHGHRRAGFDLLPRTYGVSYSAGQFGLLVCLSPCAIDTLITLVVWTAPTLGADVYS
jgi:hypothetical protein